MSNINVISYAMVRILSLVALFMGFFGHAIGAELEILVKEENGMPVEDAVVFAMRAEGVPADAPQRRAKTAVIAQTSQEFEPYVTAIEVGTAISFPNQDGILHNVYSFSKAKKFELPLYKDTPPHPVVFDKPGVVILGCNIHDWMVAYVYVLETPYFSKTGVDGRGVLSMLPAGSYALQVWHPRKKGRGSSQEQRFRLALESRESTEFVIALKAQWRPRRAPNPN